MSRKKRVQDPAAQLEDMEARVNYDLDYLRRWSPMLDIKIILLTAVKIFRDDKAY